MKKTTFLAARLSAVLALALFASIVHAQDAKSSQKEEKNRNVMLNAASANGPREIQIGLPSADVNVLENGLPVTYATNPHSVNANWRSDASLSHVGLLKISETAITTGNIGYAVNSFTQLGQEGFHGRLDYKANHFGLNEYSLNLNGGMGKGWYYSANMYQDFDPGTFDIKSSRNQDRTQIYKAAITKRYDGNRGELTAMYRYSKSHPVYSFATQSAPFIYVGDGSVKEFGKFRLGTTSYLPVDADMTYRDMRTGELRQTSFYDAAKNYSNEFLLTNQYKWDNGLTWKFSTRYDHARGAMVYQTPMSLLEAQAKDAAGNALYTIYCRTGSGLHGHARFESLGQLPLSGQTLRQHQRSLLLQWLLGKFRRRQLAGQPPSCVGMHRGELPKSDRCERKYRRCGISHQG